MTDIEIAQAHEMKKIVDVAAKAGIDEKHLELYGNYKAKLDLSEIRIRAAGRKWQTSARPRGRSCAPARGGRACPPR